MNRLSTAIRLTIWCLATFAVMELVFGAAMWFTLRGNLYDLVDNRLDTQVDDLKRFLQMQNHEVSSAQLRQAMNEKYANQHAGDYLELYLENGDMAFRGLSLQGNPAALLPPDQVKRPLQRTQKIGDRPFRFFFQRISVNGRAYIVEMGMPADDAVRTLHEFQFRLLLAGTLLWFVGGMVVYLISRRIVPSGAVDRSGKPKP